MDRTDKRALVVFVVAIFVLLGLATWGGTCLGESRVRTQYEEAKVQLGSATAQLSQLQSALASLQKDNDTLRTRLESVQADLSQLQSASASLQKDNDALRTRLESVQADLSQLQSAAASLQKDNDALRTRLESVQADLTRSQSASASLQTDNNALRTKLGSAESELSQLQSRYGILQDSNAALRTQLASAQTQVSQAQSTQNVLQQDNAALRAQLALWYAWLRSSPPPPVIPTVTPGPSLTLSTTIGPPGTTITVTGSGFAASTYGNVFIDVNHNGTNDPGEPIQYGTTSPTGTFSTTLIVPAAPAAPPGIYQIMAGFPVGLPAQASVAFTVTAVQAGGG